MVEGSKKSLKLNNEPDLKIYFEDGSVTTAEIKTTSKNIMFTEKDKPSELIPFHFNKSKRENAETLFLININTWNLTVVDVKNDEFITSGNVFKYYSRLLKTLLDNNSLNRILGLKGHVI